MDTLAGNVVMTAGVVAYNPFLVKMVEESIGQKVWVPQGPQLTGIVVAAPFRNGKL